MKIRTLVVDDEELARLLVSKFLETEVDFELIGTASDGFQALKLIHEQKPDLLILDIQMPKLTGLELLEVLENPPQIIFSTAYDQYAINAFEKSAVDYLLKPYSKERFSKALQKAKENFKANYNVENDIQKIIENKAAREVNLSRIVVKQGSKIEMIPLEELVFIEAFGDYTKLHAKSGKFLKQKSMKELEDQLGNFLRIHRSFLVNPNFIEKLEPYEKSNYRLVLKDGSQLSVSRAGYKMLKETLGW